LHDYIILVDGPATVVIHTITAGIVNLSQTGSTGRFVAVYTVAGTCTCAYTAIYYGIIFVYAAATVVVDPVTWIVGQLAYPRITSRLFPSVTGWHTGASTHAAIGNDITFISFPIAIVIDTIAGAVLVIDGCAWDAGYFGAAITDRGTSASALTALYELVILIDSSIAIAIDIITDRIV
jgi:hypothetical protein